MIEDEAVESAQHTRRRWPLGVAVAVLLICGALAWMFMPHDIRQDTPTPFPANFKMPSAFQLYYPYDLPAGLSVDKDTLSSTGQAVTYVVDAGNLKKFNVSVQAMPANYDFTAFKKKFKEGDEFPVPAGAAFIGDAGNGLIGSIRTPDNTWIIITTDDYSAKGLTADFSRSFRKVPR